MPTHTELRVRCPVDPLIKEWFRPIEYKDHVPESHWEFGYFGRHYIMAVPTEIIDPAWPKEMMPRFFELQVKTLFEYAWSEAEHDLGYKPGEEPLTPMQIRSLAYTSAQAWGADRAFEDLFKERNRPRPQRRDFCATDSMICATFRMGGAANL